MHALVKERYLEHKMEEVYDKCKLALENGDSVNHANELYKLFTDDEISSKIAEIVKPPEMKGDLEVVYQTNKNLSRAIPNHTGDWYFTGNFPTKGGMRVANRSFVNYMEGKLVRAY